MQILSPLCLGHVNDLPGYPTQKIDSLLAVSQAVTFLRYDWPVEHGISTDEVKAVIFDIASVLRLVPRQHALIVSTNKWFINRVERKRYSDLNYPALRAK